MGRGVVTTESIRAALRAGVREFHVPPGAIVTAAARELANSRGLRLLAGRPRTRSFWVGANWKMNHTRSEVASFLAAFRCPRTAAEVVLFPPLLYLEQVKAALWGDGVQLGAQNVYPGERGAFTGEVSAVQLRSVGVSHVLIGHSERRRLFGEESALLREKVLSALAAGLRVVYCVGETWRERSSGRTRPVIRGQLVEVLRGLELDGAAERLLVAYEPVWAIGTGRRPTPEAVALVHDQIRRELGRLFGAGGEGIRIVYGGSVTTESCAELARRVEVDGFLVGGASLEARSFMSLLGNALSARREAGGYP